MRPPGRSRHRGEVREQRVEPAPRVQVGAPSRGGWRADLEVLAHAEVGEDAPVLGHLAEAEAADAIRRQRRDVACRERRRGRAGARIRPMIAFIVVDLPAPLRPTRATHSPAPTPSETPKRICAWPYQASSRCDVKHRSARAASARSRAAAEVDLAHARVVAHRRGRPFGDQLAARQHDDAVGMREDDVHAVLGEEDADRLLAREARAPAPSIRSARAAPCRRSARPSAAGAAGWRARSPARRA